MVLIQDETSGICLIEYKNPLVFKYTNMEDLFSGFVAAIQKVSEELQIGSLTEISTEGSCEDGVHGHHCIIYREEPINVIIILDDYKEHKPIEFWKEKAKEVAWHFLSQFREAYNPNYISRFEAFLPDLKEIVTSENII